MILSFLEPFEIRGEKAPYLWVFYKQLRDFGVDDVLYVASNDYFVNPEVLKKKNRWEFLEYPQKNNKYTIPSYNKILSAKKEIIDITVYEVLTKKFTDNISIWKFLLTQRYTPLEKRLEEIINKYDIEFIVSWSNNASLKYIASKYNIPIIHNEKGPLRGPLYYDTAYFDFSGVNGNTESEKRFNLFEVEKLLDIEDLRNLFLKNKDICLKDEPEYEIGVALQVEDDSNLIAYSNGYDNLKLLNEVRYFYNKKDILIRNHPLSGIKVSNKYGVIDNSQNSIEFMSKCKRVATINSSVGFEALMWGKEVCAKGDSPYYFFVSHKCDENLNRGYKKFLNFFLLNYLIPYDYLFDKEYYRWRIKVKDEKEIFNRHKKFWLFKNNLDLNEEIISRKMFFLILQEYKHKIEEKNNQLKEYQETIEKKNNQLKEYQETIEKKNNQLKEYQETLSQKEIQIKDLTLRNQYLLNEVLMYSTSTSWKMTRVFRQIKKLLRKIR